MALKKNDTNKIINSTISNNNSNNIIINESFQSNKIKGSKSIKSTTKMKENKLKISNKSTFDKKTKNKIIKKDIKKEGLINKKAKKIREKIVFDLKLTNKEKEKLRNLQVQSQKSSDNIFMNKLNLNKIKLFANLLEKQQNLYEQIKKIIAKENYLDECSLNNLEEKNLFYKNIQSYNIKHLEENKKNILEKISSINEEIKDLNLSNQKSSIIINNNNHNNNKNEYLDKINKEKIDNDINKKIMNLKMQSNLSIQKIKEEAELKLEKRKFELDLIQKEKIQKKENELLIKKSEEKKIEEQRKQKADSTIEICKQFLNNSLLKGRDNNYLYMKMATSFDKKEEDYKNKVLKNKINKEKEISKELDKKDNPNDKKNLEENESFKILKQIWKERTDLLPKYNSPIFQKVIESEENIKENERNKLENKKKFIFLRQKYGKERVHLPLISKILKREREKRIKEKENELKIKKNQIHNYIRLQKRKKYNSRNNISSSKDLAKSYTAINLGNNQINNQREKTIIKLTKKASSEINHLDEIKSDKSMRNKIEENKIKNEKKNNNNIHKKELNVEIVKGKIEIMEAKYKRGKELLKLKGGYIQNKELGDSMNNILIDSIKNKLDIIENIYKKE